MCVLTSCNFHEVEVTGAYGHPLFQRGQCDIAAQICRAANPSRKNKRHRQGSQDLALNVGGKDYVRSEPERLSLLQVVEERSEHCSNDTRIKSSADIITMDLLGLEKKHDSMIGRPQGDLEKYATKVPPFPDHTTTTSSMACRESHLPDSFLDLSSVLLGNQYRVPNHSSIVVDRDEDDIRTEIIRTFLG